MHYTFKKNNFIVNVCAFLQLKQGNNLLKMVNKTNRLVNFGYATYEII